MGDAATWFDEAEESGGDKGGEKELMEVDLCLGSLCFVCFSISYNLCI